MSLFKKSREINNAKPEWQGSWWFAPYGPSPVEMPRPSSSMTTWARVGAPLLGNAPAGTFITTYEAT
jgi:hypothetical protein